MEIYFVCTPMVGVLLYQSILLSPPLPVKLSFNFTATMAVFYIFFATFISSRIHVSAHSSYSCLNSIVAQNRLKLNVKLKLKLIGLIERLAGPNIAIYCLDLFPFTSQAFADVKTILY